MEAIIRSAKGFAFLHFLLGLVPLVWPLLLLSYGLRAALVLGYWPQYDQPDPKELGFIIHHQIVDCAFNVAFHSTLIWILLRFTLGAYFSEDELRRNTIAFLTTVGICVAFFVIDPLGLIGWYCD
jgi:hypothetical protein